MDKQREAFEKWWNNECEVWLPSTEYDTAWKAWQAALSSAPSAEPVRNPDKFRPIWSEALKEFVNSPDVLTPGSVQWVRTVPPNLSAAVAAAREQDAEVCAALRLEWARMKVGATDGRYDMMEDAATVCEDEIRALQTEDGLAALREFGLKVGEAAIYYDVDTKIAMTEIVDRVMKGE